VRIKVPKIYKDIYTKDVRYYFLSGGRGSGKSWAVADRLIFEAIKNPETDFLCLREIQLSIKHSSKKLLESRISFYGLDDMFRILNTHIEIKGGGDIIFKGLQNHTADSIKSFEGFSFVWCEEAQSLSKFSLDILTPTIRQENSKLFFTYNPRFENDPIIKLMKEVDNKIHIHTTYLDNPFCPDVIIKEAENLKKKNIKKYNHIYLGQYIQDVDGIFKVDWLEWGDYKNLNFDYYFIVVDTAVKDKDINDNTVFSAFGVISDRLYLLDLFVGKVLSVEREQIFYDFYKRNSKFPFKGAFIEDKASGSDLIQRAKRKGFIIKELIPKKSKLLRADDISTYFETYHLRVDNSIIFKQELINEIMLFGTDFADKDDIVDTIIYAFDLVYREKLIYDYSKLL